MKGNSSIAVVPLANGCACVGNLLAFALAAKVAELADAPDLGSGAVRRGGSSPPFRTNNLNPAVLQIILDTKEGHIEFKSCDC